MNRNSAVSDKYAKALIDIAIDCDKPKIFQNQLEFVIEVFSSSNDLSVVMKNPSITSSEKHDIIDAIFSNKLDVNLLNFIKLLIDRNRLGYIESIYHSYNDILALHNNQKNVEIISAVDLDDNIKLKIIKKLQQKLNCNIIPMWSKNENVIAGLIFKYDDIVIDTSLKTKLDNMSKNMLR